MNASPAFWATVETLIAPASTRPAGRYLIAAALIAAALLLRLAIAPPEAGLPFITFFPAAALAAIFGGLGPGLLVTAVCAGLAAALFMPPVGSDSYTEVSVLVYVANGILVCAAIEVMHRYHRVYKRATADLVTAKTMEEAARHATEAINRELQESNRDLEQFAYVASHDLQEPLRIIVSYAQLLKRRYHGRIDGDANAFLDFMVEGATRMQTMVIDLLEYSRLDRTGETATRFDSGEAIAAVVASLSLAVTEAGAVVELGAMPPIHYHRSQFLRLVRNLIDNAVKYRDPARPLTVRINARRDGDRWVFSVADNGIGIDPAYFSRIFLIFQRLHTRDKYDGTGIGLAMCKRIVERHGGKIWIESQPGGGTTVRFDLRVHGDESHADGTPSSQ